MNKKNIHNKPYDLTKLKESHPPLTEFLVPKENGELTIDFSDASALFHLNKALLISDYGLVDWNIPEGYLCPGVPGRADYIHHLYDHLKEEKIDLNNVHGLDVGAGANAIYTILGSQIHGWKMVGVDIDPVAVENARANIGFTPKTEKNCTIRLQKNPANLFNGAILPGEHFHFTMCNPPFFSSSEEARKKNKQKSRNLDIVTKNTRNFSGSNRELWCNGGEALFLKRMIKESEQFKSQVDWFSSLVSNSDNLPKLLKQLSKIEAIHKIISHDIGNKKSRILLWKFP